MHFLLSELTGGDTRSIGMADKVVLLVNQQPELIDLIFQGMNSNDPVLCMRCADVLEKVTRNKPQLLIDYKQNLLEIFFNTTQIQVCWHVTQMLPRLPLSETQIKQVIRQLLVNTNHRSRLVKTMSMQALVDLAFIHPTYKHEIKQHIQELIVIGSPAMKVRGRKLLARWA